MLFFSVGKYDYIFCKRLEIKRYAICFLCGFFSFLMGRHLLSYYFDYEVEAFSEDVNTHAELCMLLSLVTVFFLYVLLCA